MSDTGQLVDMYCPEAHEAALTAAAYDAESGAAITADAWGVIAITKPGQSAPDIIFQPGTSIYGAVDVSLGGALVAVGDEAGSVWVLNTWDGSVVFEDHKEGPAGEARAFRALSFNPQGTVLACLSVDGIIRIYDIQRWERMGNFQGFGGESLTFDQHGDRILCIDTLGQPKLVDLLSQEIIDLEMVPGGVRVAYFTPEGDHIVAMGQGGITLIELPEGNVVNSFSARGSSGMVAIVISPDGDEVAAISGRSVHTFSLPDLQPVASDKHGAPEATNACLWDHKGVAVGGSDGMLHRPGAKPSLEPVICVGGFGEHRLAVHGDRIATWHKTRRRRPFNAKKRYVEVRIDRDGRLISAVPEDGTGVDVFEARTGRHLFNAGPDTADTIKMEVGGTCVALMLQKGGMRWYDLKANNVFELPWVETFALSGGGTWIGAVTPKGNVKVIDPATGKDAIPPPEPLADVPVSLVSFVNRRPDMLVMDEEGVLGIYDLTNAVKENIAVEGADVLDLNVAVDRLWGITGGEFAAVRFQEPEMGTATVIYVNVQEGEVVSEINDLLPYAWVDPETGYILQPGRGGAIVEMDMYGKERQVYRSLPENEWVCYNWEGILDASPDAGF